jgi:hypothetical protein
MSNQQLYSLDQQSTPMDFNQPKIQAFKNAAANSGGGGGRNLGLIFSESFAT